MFIAHISIIDINFKALPLSLFFFFFLFLSVSQLEEAQTRRDDKLLQRHRDVLQRIDEELPQVSKRSETKKVGSAKNLQLVQS